MPTTTTSPPAADPSEAVRLPGRAIAEEADIVEPLTGILKGLNILPDKEDLDQAGGPGAVIGGPPQSVALLESGASAIAKWWAAGAGAMIVGLWGGVRGFYLGEDAATQRVILIGAAIVTSALVLAIAALLSADLRSRASAQVATVKARAEVATMFIEASRASSMPGGQAGLPGSEHGTDVIPLHYAPTVQYVAVGGTDEGGWHVLAAHAHAHADGDDGDDIEYLLVKGDRQVWAPAADVRF